ncbi:MAG: carboxylesterase [Pseudomonadota bacterium]
MERLDYLEEVHGAHPDAAIIWLHGLGADGYDFKPIVQQLNLPEEINIHFVFPHAPVMPVTINQGISMNAWYDIYQLSMDAKEDETGIENSMHLLEDLISTKFSHLDPERIILAGFSQGGAQVLHTALHGRLQYGGLMVLSGYLAVRNNAQSGRLPDYNIFMAHGIQDEVLPIAIAEMAHKVLTDLGMQIDWHRYSMAHQLCAQELVDIRAYILNRLTD